MGSGGFESGSDLPAPPPTTNFDDEPPLLEGAWPVAEAALPSRVHHK